MKYLFIIVLFVSGCHSYSGCNDFTKCTIDDVIVHVNNFSPNFDIDDYEYNFFVIDGEYYYSQFPKGEAFVFGSDFNLVMDASCNVVGTFGGGR